MHITFIQGNRHTRRTLTENFLPQLEHVETSLSSSHLLSPARDCITCSRGEDKREGEREGKGGGGGGGRRGREGGRGRGGGGEREEEGEGGGGTKGEESCGKVLA